VTPVHLLSSYTNRNPRTSYEWFTKTTNLLLDAGARDALIGEPTVLKAFGISLAGFKFLQGEIYPPGITMSPQFRCDVAQTFWSAEYNTPLLIKHIVSSQDQVDLAVITLTSGYGSTLFHKIASCLADPYVVPRGQDSDLEISPDDLHELDKHGSNRFMGRELLRDCLLAGTVGMISQVDRDGQSPLCKLLGYLGSNGFNDLNEVVSDWLFDLRASGVDLMEYGAAEREYIFRYPDKYKYCGPSITAKANLRSLRYHWGPECPWTCRLITLSYGPEPEDWILWFDEWTDRFAGEFWAGIEDHEPGMQLDENESFQIPGSWVGCDDE